jgi:DNA-binding HxlR family transcriptional regulator
MNVQRPRAATTSPITESVQPRGCPVMAFQAMISGKYKIRILWDLRGGPRRYSEIRTGLLSGATGTREIAPRVLSRELKALAETGMIARKDFGLVPPKVEYRLTEAGERFVPIIAVRAHHRRYPRLGRTPSCRTPARPRAGARLSRSLRDASRARHWNATMIARF